MITVIILGFSLSMDAFAAALTSGACADKVRTRTALKTAAVYGCFQGLMPIFGFYLGKSLLRYISAYDHWVAFVLLAFIGVKMLTDALKADGSCPKTTDYSGVKILVVMAFLTSIDAFIVGISLAIEATNIYLSALIITLITFLMCYFGYNLGGRLGERYKRGSLALGGVILILLGIKILADHLLF